jgi:hypothetical protein
MRVYDLTSSVRKAVGEGGAHRRQRLEILLPINQRRWGLAHIARHIIDTHFEPLFLEVFGIL